MKNRVLILAIIIIGLFGLTLAAAESPSRLSAKAPAFEPADAPAVAPVFGSDAWMMKEYRVCYDEVHDEAADPALRSKRLGMLLNNAAYRGNADLFLWCFRHGANIGLLNLSHMQVFFQRFIYSPIYCFLVSDVDALLKSGLDSKNPLVVYCAIAMGARVDKILKSDVTAFFVENIDYLRKAYGLQEDGDDEVLDYNKLLMEAARRGDSLTMRWCIDRGADKDYKNARSKTPLHEAAAWGKLRATQLLVALGADIEIVATAGRKTAEQIAGDRWKKKGAGKGDGNYCVSNYLKRMRAVRASAQ